MSKRKIILFPLVAILTVAVLPVIVSGAPLRPIAESGTFTLSYPQLSPPDFGPNVYYDDNVTLVYNIVVRWSSITYPNGDVRQTLTADGTVDVYYTADLANQIDTRSCSVSLGFYDAGGDGIIPGAGGFYEVNWTHSSLLNMERLHHIHQVSGVYTRNVWIRNGDGWGKVTVFTQPPTVLIVNE